jgi:error-prone DNA polymerase
MREADAAMIMAARGAGYRDVEDVWRRSGVAVAALETLAKGDAFAGLGLDRRAALWRIKGFDDKALPLLAFAAAADGGSTAPGRNDFVSLFAEPTVLLPRMTLGEQVIEDYGALRLSIRTHPLALLRPALRRDGVLPNAALAAHPVNQRVAIAGLVLVRQRPGTAKGVIFATLEDETGVANVIVWPHVFERYRRVVLGSLLLRVVGKLQRESGIVHVVADHLADLSPMLSTLAHIDGAEEPAAAVFSGAIARADEVKRPGRDPRDPDVARRVMPRGRNFH